MDYTLGEAVKPLSGSLKIGVTVQKGDTFLDMMSEGISKRAQEDGVTVEFADSGGDISKQESQVKDFISKGYDGVIVVPDDAEKTAPITQAALAGNMPLVYVNRLPVDIPREIPYVGSDSLVAGELEMGELARLANYQGSIGILMGTPNQEAPIMRTKGCENVAAKWPNLQVVRKAGAEWSRDNARGIVSSWYKDGGPQVNIICANNDEMALGAVDAAKAEGKLGSTLIGGVDAISDALDSLAAGDMKVTVLQNAPGQGGGAVDMIVKMRNNEPVPSVVNIPFELVTPANLAQYR